jgi:hypothetical protein
MEPTFNTSFIPKKSLQADVSGSAPGKYVNRRTVHGPGYFLTLLIFILAVVGSVGMFAYTKMIDGRIKEKITELDRARAAYKPEIIQELRRADSRLRYAHQLVTNHAAVTPLLSVIEQLTLRNIQYTLLFLTSGDSSGASASAPSVQMLGKASDMPPVALLVDEFRTSPYLGNPQVTKLQRIDGNIEFGVMAEVLPEILKFTRLTEKGVINTLPPAATVPMATSTTEVTSTTTSTTTGQQTATSTR